MSKSDLFRLIREKIKPGTEIPKLTGSCFQNKGWGRRRGEEALVYIIPGGYEKGITVSEFNKAYCWLMETGSFSKKWFDENMQACAKEGGCNFYAIGGIFGLLGLVNYRRGEYYLFDP